MIGTLLAVAVFGGIYEITYTHDIDRGHWMKSTLVAKSAEDAVENAEHCFGYTITKVEEVNPIPKVSEVKSIMDKAKLLESAIKKYETKREKARSSDSGRAGKIAADVATDCHHIEVLEASLHAACVDAGVADPRDPSEYEERSWWLSEFHEQRWKPESPKRLPTAR
ncbi:hypothetical protein [Rosistilla oblonga]|uniref:hypothetical protein n=1 Tax=Rosistilla oblonga TaxID=2527990 RepID=UPI003A9853EB